MPEKPQEVVETKTELASQKTAKKGRISFSAVKAIITVTAIVVLLVVVTQIYYPGLLPWN